MMCPIRARPVAGRWRVARTPPPRSSKMIEWSDSSVERVIAYTTGTGRSGPMLGRGSVRRPVTMRPSTRRAGSRSR
ncbi:hypothetical protein [Nonomuraea sp. NPDC050783]|uniref:hypothetical protein n=1 Tax=Nonomuraea sp. NPDC050783 TaxID=3154634 RepID=UPI0034670A91